MHTMTDEPSEDPLGLRSESGSYRWITMFDILALPFATEFVPDLGWQVNPGEFVRWSSGLQKDISNVVEEWAAGRADIDDVAAVISSTLTACSTLFGSEAEMRLRAWALLPNMWMKDAAAFLTRGSEWLDRADAAHPCFDVLRRMHAAYLDISARLDRFCEELPDYSDAIDGVVSDLFVLTEVSCAASAALALRDVDANVLAAFYEDIDRMNAEHSRWTTPSHIREPFFERFAVAGLIERYG
jgi:hypothetical protein